VGDTKALYLKEAKKKSSPQIDHNHLYTKCGVKINS
jgi:hypothetical protein